MTISLIATRGHDKNKLRLCSVIKKKLCGVINTMYSAQFLYRQEISQSLEHQQQNVFGHQYWVRLIKNHEKTVNWLLNRRYSYKIHHIWLHCVIDTAELVAHANISANSRPYAKILQHTNNRHRWLRIMKKNVSKLSWHWPFKGV